MDSVDRPMPVLIVACVYIAVGSVGFVLPLQRIDGLCQGQCRDRADGVARIISGAFMLRGHNWARWLAFAWMAFHVAISFPGAPRICCALSDPRIGLLDAVSFRLEAVF